jgi:alpha/beta superfamily hydrolase
LRPAKTDRLLLDGPAGTIEVDISDPGLVADSERRAIAVIAHPHPLMGGTKDNKVVTTLARALYALGYVALRPNFRGVGASAGTHDEGRGETADLIAVVRYAQEKYGPLPLACAGFSFGSFVQTRVAKEIHPDQLILVAPAVNRFPTEEVAAGTLVIHGERDDVVPLAAVLDWARPQNLPVVVVPGGEHFFHGRLHVLQEIVTRHCR